MLLTHAFNTVAGFSNAAAATRQRGRFCFHALRCRGLGVRSRPLFRSGNKRRRLPVSGFHHRSLLGRAAFCVGHYRRIYGTHAFPDDGAAGLRGALHHLRFEWLTETASPCAVFSPGILIFSACEWARLLPRKLSRAKMMRALHGAADDGSIASISWPMRRKFRRSASRKIIGFVSWTCA